jgi:hypothetical protein
VGLGAVRCGILGTRGAAAPPWVRALLAHSLAPGAGLPRAASPSRLGMEASSAAGLGAVRYHHASVLHSSIKQVTCVGALVRPGAGSSRPPGDRLPI